VTDAVQRAERNVGALTAFLGISTIVLGALGNFVAAVTLISGAILGWKLGVISIAEQDNEDA
jgi:hypothetical protein